MKPASTPAAPRPFQPVSALPALLFVALAANAAPIAHAAPVPDRAGITVSGNGEVSATPDRARLAMAVEITKPQLKDAQAEANRIVRDYLAQARALGARDEDISTAGLSIRSEYDYSKPGTRKFIGYHVTRSITVVVHDLDKIGDYLQRATDAGINSMSDPVLESSKAEELQRQALVKAAEDARAKAKVLADTLGVKLGSVHTLDASSSMQNPSPPQPMMRVKAMAANLSGNEDMGFAAGQINYDATLTADFDLQP